MCRTERFEQNFEDICVRSSKIKILAGFHLHYTIYRALLNDDVQFIDQFFSGQTPDIYGYFDQVKYTQRSMPIENDFNRFMQRYDIPLVNGSSMNNVLNYHRNPTGVFMTSFKNATNMRAKMYMGRLFESYYAAIDMQLGQIPAAAVVAARKLAIDHAKRYRYRFEIPYYSFTSNYSIH